jgi:[citrate (pro-3S)-lyase] ligase
MVPPALPLLTAADRSEARRLVESLGLAFEDGCDDLVGIHDGGRLVATAARAGYVLKMFAVDEAWQGGDTLGQLVTTLADLGRRAGHDALFVYTRPAQAPSFQACNFRLLVTCGEVALLELGGGLETYLHGYRHLREALSGRDAQTESGAATPTAGLPRRSAVGAEAGSVVVNGNPFTLGHQYLVEHAAARVRRLYVFIVREDRPVFPFDVRYKLARDGVAHLQNVVLLDTSRYAVSAGTFPSYFLRQHDEASRLQMEVDAGLFGAQLAPAFGISRRFVGDEPYCDTTREYNAALARVLPEYGVALDVVARAGDEAGVFSATRVRAALAAGDLDSVARAVPKTTLAFLRSREGSAVVRRLAGR